MMMVVMMVMAAPRLRMAENERLDHDRHRARIRQLLADIDEVEILEIDAVDRDDPRARQELALQNVADELRVVGVILHRVGHALREIADQRIRWPELPVKRERDRALAIDVEALERLGDGR